MNYSLSHLCRRKLLDLDAECYTLQDENISKNIRMRITVLDIVIWGGKVSVIWSQIALYGSADASP